MERRKEDLVGPMDELGGVRKVDGSDKCPYEAGGHEDTNSKGEKGRGSVLLCFEGGQGRLLQPSCVGLEIVRPAFTIPPSPRRTPARVGVPPARRQRRRSHAPIVAFTKRLPERCVSGEIGNDNARGNNREHDDAGGRRANESGRRHGGV